MAFLLPTGRARIGSIVHEFVDDTRPTSVLAVERGRRIQLKCWYPADPARGSRPELIWQELRADSATPRLGRALLAVLRQRTSTHSGAPFAAHAERSPLVVYNHGLVSFAAENTSLAEELASHGCIVVSLRHAEQLVEFRGLEAHQSAAKKRAAAALAAALRKASGEARARLAVEYYVASETTGRIVVERAADTSFVLDRVHELIAQIPRAPAPASGPARFHLAGFSVGGAVATECAKRDARVASIVNLDGGMQGTPGEGEIRVPYLMMYSAANEAMNAALLPNSAHRVALPGTTHLNYHDVSLLVPGLRLLRAIGTADARATLAARNRTVVEFYRSVGALGF